MNVNSLCSFTTSKKWTKLTDNNVTTAAFCTSIEHVFDVSAILLHYKLHTMQPFTNTLLSINKTWLGQFLPCQCRLLVSVCQLGQNFIDGRPSTEGHPDDVIHLIQVWASRRPHAWLKWPACSCTASDTLCFWTCGEVWLLSFSGWCHFNFPNWFK